MHETKTKLLDIRDRIKRAKFYFDESDMEKKISELEEKTIQPNFWNDNRKAAKISQELSDLKSTVGAWDNMEKSCGELIELCDIIADEHEPKAREDVIKETETLEKKIRKEEIKLFLNGKYDKNDAILSVHAGTGGLDAKDFAAMLLRMYMRYSEKQDFKVEILEKADEEEAGIKDATIEIKGPYAYGYLKEEKGVHRLVRQSPFNAGHTRETSFALVEVMPKLEDESEVELKDDELKIEACRSSGPGGQNVNKTSTAIRIVHIPTGLTASCQSERSQIQNKERAMKVLKGKIASLMEEARAKTIDELKTNVHDVGWGYHIRSYVLHPYKLVKDQRTGFESTNPDKVLDGETLDEFIEYSLEKKLLK